MGANSFEDDYFICPCCGAELPLSADFCRDCGASADSVWNTDEDVTDDVSDFDQDDEFDYEDYLRREFPDHASARPAPGPHRVFFALIVIVVCLLLLLMSLWPA
jgi:hypothetical protein